MFAIVEAMLGGDGSQPAYAGKRPLSKIETRIAAAFFGRFARALDRRLASDRGDAFMLEAAANSSISTPSAAAAPPWSPSS